MNTINFAALVSADLTLASAETAAATFVSHVTVLAPVIVPELSGGKPRNGSAEKVILTDIFDAYAAKGLSKAAATQARTRLLNSLRIVAANPRVAAETDADYATRVLAARMVANVGDQAALLAAIAGKGEQAKAAAKAKRANAAKAAADRKAADTAKSAADGNPNSPAAAAKAAKAEADAAKAAADAAAKANPQAAAEARATLVEQNRIQSPKTMRGLVLAFEAGEIDDAAWEQTKTDWEYVLGLAKAARRPVIDGTTEAPKAKRTRKAKAA